MKKINFKKQASKMLFKAKKQARKPFGSADGVKKNAAKMSNKMTAPEKAFDNMMKKLNIECEPQKIVANKIYDFYIPKSNTLVEIQGDYWHANPLIYEGKELNKTQIKNIKNDIFKKTLALGRGYLLELVWEHDLNNNLEKLNERFIKLWK